jgi:hypothetical protein
MLWDKLFWAWFLISSSIVVIAILVEFSFLSEIFGVILAGLGVIKLASETARERIPAKNIKVSRYLVKKIKGNNSRKR